MALLLARESKSVTKTQKRASAVWLAALFTITLGLSVATASAVEMNGPLPHSPLVPIDAQRIVVTSSLPSGSVGNTYSGVFSASGGVAPYRYTLISGSLPQGLVLNPQTGAVSGTPTAAGTSTAWIVVRDARLMAGTLQVHISVAGSEQLSVSISVSPTSTSVTAGGSRQFTASVLGTSNTAVTWSASAGSISNAGVFTAPNVSSATSVTVRVTSVADSTKSASSVVSVQAVAAPTISVSVSPASASVKSGAGQQFVATVQGSSNTAVTWSASAGAVSPSGMFTAPSVTANTTVTVTATSSANTTKKASVNVAVSTITPPSNPLTITTPSVPGAQSSTSYAYLIGASGGTTPYTWSLASGSLPSGFSLANNGQLGGNTTQTGQFTFTAQVQDASNNSARQSFSFSVSAPPPPNTPPSGSYDGPAELPRIYMQTALANTPAPGAVIPVPAGGSLQNALNNAQCGDTITLAAGSMFSGIFTLPAKACDDQHWIIIRTSAPDSSLPPEGTRMQPCYAGVASLPGRPAFNCNGTHNVLAIVSDPQGNTSGPFVLASGANHYRLLGLEITRAAGTGIDYQFVGVPTGPADHIILDRVWLAGTAQDESKNGINLSGMTYAALIDSYSSDFHCTSGVGVCTDAKVVGGGNSTLPGGPFKITNNFIEASTEGILLGGGPATTTPADIEIRHNHFFKPLMWLVTQPGFVGGAGGHPFMVKNLLELKNAQRVLIEGNIFEYTWGGYSQAGYALLLTPKNQASGCPMCEVTDVTIRYNTFSHSGAGISMANVPDDNGAIGYAGERYSIHDITLDDISASFYSASPGSSSGTLFQVFSGWPTSALNSVSINHVTGFGDPHSKIISLGNNPTYPEMYGFSMTNSIVGQSLYPVWSTGGTSNCANPDIPIISMNACFTNYTFSHNAIIATSYASTKWPVGNSFPSAASAVQFTSFSNGNGGSYQLLSSSPFAAAGSDGKDLGADLNAIQAATAGVY